MLKSIQKNTDNMTSKKNRHFLVIKKFGEHNSNINKKKHNQTTYLWKLEGYLNSKQNH